MNEVTITIHIYSDAGFVPQQVLDGAMAHAKKHNVSKVSIVATSNDWSVYHGRLRDNINLSERWERINP